MCPAYIAAHLNLFDGFFASTDVHNLSGMQRLTSLESRFGVKGFDYIGKLAQRHCNLAPCTKKTYAIDPSPSIIKKLKALNIEPTLIQQL